MDDGRTDARPWVSYKLAGSGEIKNDGLTTQLISAFVFTTYIRVATKFYNIFLIFP